MGLAPVLLCNNKGDREGRPYQNKNPVLDANQSMRD